MRRSNIALFVTHQGCKHKCSFCNQGIISGHFRTALPQDVVNAAEKARKSLGENSINSEIAFFGGSFTAIDRDYMTALLEAAYPYIRDGVFKGVRVSTRPDAVDCDVLELLKDYGVTAIELGAQSMDDGVLRLNMRGHTAQEVVKASGLIREYGIELGLQMMTGLYGDTYDLCIESAKKIIALRPETVRIYPTVVLENTYLAELYKSGEYEPQSLDEAVTLCSRLLRMFGESETRVIRLGLHSGGGADEGYLAGPYHPAFREICESGIYYQNTLESIRFQELKKGRYIIYVNPGGISAATGHKRSNIEALSKKGFACRVKGNPLLEKYQVVIQQEVGNG